MTPEKKRPVGADALCLITDAERAWYASAELRVFVMSSSDSNQVLIVGAGIAGPALAIALKRAGIDSVVYECHPLPRDGAGAFLNLAPNGLNVLRSLGLGERAFALGFANDRLVFHNERGRVLAEVEVGGATVLRGHLSRALREAAAEAGVRIVFDSRLEGVEEVENGVIARFANGTSVKARMLIAADGIHSQVRERVFPEVPKPAYTGIMNLGGVVSTDLPATGTAMHMIFGHLAFFGYAVRPSGETYWFSNFAQSVEPTADDMNVFPVDAVKERLLEVHRDDPPEVTRILHAVTRHIGAYPVYDIPSIPSWHRSAVCLIGDAAHAVGPHMGQGTALALEDAFVLAKCLRDLADPAAAFATFERLRRERVERAVRQSRATGQQKTPTGILGRRFRDFVLPLFLRRGAQATRWMYGYELDWEERVSPTAA